jgi:Fe-S-cluster containining protein
MAKTPEKCSACGICCRLFLINLNEEEYRSKKYLTMFSSFGFVEDFAEAEQDGCNLLARNDDDSCIYLKDNKCTMHSEKPAVCQRFFCKSDDRKFKGMIDDINNYKKKSA